MTLHKQGAAVAHLDNLTALRFFAAFSVFLHHLKPFGLDISKYVWHLNLGWTVSFFFVLSGFVLAFSYDGRLKTRDDAIGFMLVRLFRLWPLHLTCVALALYVKNIDVDFNKIYLLLTLQHSWVPKYVTAFYVNAVSWSISVELFFYITFAFIMVLPKQKMFVVIAFWVLCILCLMLAVSWAPQYFPFSRPTGNAFDDGVTANSFFHLFPATRIMEFFAGICTYHLFKSFRIPNRFIFPSQLLCLIMIALYIPIHQDIIQFLRLHAPRVFAMTYPHLGMFPMFALVVYIFAHSDGPVSRILSTKPLLFLGETSFALYMVHQIVIFYLAQTLRLHTMTWAGWAALAAFALSLALSALLYSLVEVPSRDWAKRRFMKARTPKVAPPEPLVP